VSSAVRFSARTGRTQTPRALTRDEVRQVDRIAIEEYGLPGLVLMENAGRGAAEWLAELAPASTAVACGVGNNGGDGFVLARHFLNRGLPVRVLLCGDPTGLRGDALVQAGVLARAGIPLESPPPGEAAGSWLDGVFSQSDWIVDALLGTGLRGEVRDPHRAWIDAIHRAEKPVFALDIPSGLDCDRGTPLGAAVRATCTATFVAWKRGFLEPQAREWLGECRVIDIGLPPGLLEQHFA